MANEDKKDFNAMLNDCKDMPKFQTIADPKSIEKSGFLYRLRHGQVFSAWKMKGTRSFKKGEKILSTM